MNRDELEGQAEALKGKSTQAAVGRTGPHAHV